MPTVEALPSNHIGDDNYAIRVRAGFVLSSTADIVRIASQNQTVAATARTVQRLKRR